MNALGGIVAFGRAEAEAYAVLTAEPGPPRPTIDAMIAAVCLAQGLVLATRNTRDFEGAESISSIRGPDIRLDPAASSPARLS